MNDVKPIRALDRLKVETGSLACLGCGYEHNCGVHGCAILRAARERIANAPADIAPVVHSYWEGYSCSQYMGTDEWGEPKWRDGKFYVCHNHRCRRKTVVKSHYCPNCGAKMDGEAT